MQIITDCKLHVLAVCILCNPPQPRRGFVKYFLHYILAQRREYNDYTFSLKQGHKNNTCIRVHHPSFMLFSCAHTIAAQGYNTYPKCCPNNGNLSSTTGIPEYGTGAQGNNTPNQKQNYRSN